MHPHKKVRVLVALPDRPPPPHTLERILSLLRRYFAGPEYEVTFSCPGKNDPYSEVFAAPVQPLTDRMLGEAEILVVSETLVAHIGVSGQARLYVLEHDNWRVMLRLLNQPIDERDYPLISAHVFNRTAPHGGGEHWAYFPYGYLFRECAVGGPLDAFGFRIDEDLEQLRQRPLNHKVIAVMGGSAAWSWYAFHEETFAERLEAKLREWLQSRRSGMTVTVLNFGQGGAVLMHEMIVWMTHVERLRPEVVITHDGFNDMHYGMMNDPYLLQHGICAPYEFELWSQKLHERSDVPPRFNMHDTLRPTNFPRGIVQAYIERKTQFDRWIHASGARHVAALQPYVFSKHPSAIERETIANPRYIGHYAELRKRIPQLYEDVSLSLAASTSLDVLNLHQQFSRFGPEVTLFADYVHTTPAGDEELANLYFKVVRERQLLGDL